MDRLPLARKTPRQTSPLNLMQERYRDDPWALLIGTIFYSMVQGKKAQPVHEEFLRRWPTPNAMGLYAVAVPDGTIIGDFSYSAGERVKDEMWKLLKPLGLVSRRIDRIYDMTADFLELRPDLNPNISLLRLKGVGKYGADSFNMFCRGYLLEDVDDKELRAYVSWALSQRADGLLQADAGTAPEAGGGDAEAFQPGRGTGGG